MGWSLIDAATGNMRGYTKNPWTAFRWWRQAQKDKGTYVIYQPSLYK